MHAARSVAHLSDKRFLTMFSSSHAARSHPRRGYGHGATTAAWIFWLREQTFIPYSPIPMAHHRKEDTSPATKADIAHVLDKLGALATAFDEHRKSFAEHDKVMQAQIKTVLDLMDGRFDEMDEKFSELFTKLDDA